MKEVLGVQVERNDKGKVSLQFWGCFSLSAKNAIYLFMVFASIAALIMSYLP